MKTFVVLLVIFCSTYGDVLFTKIHSKSELPKDRDSAVKQGWKLENRDKELKIDWYSLKGDPVQLAFDGLKGLAAARLVIPKEGENDFYTKSKIFEERTISDKPFYTATVLLTDPKILKKNGRRKTEDDEIVELVLVNQKNVPNVRIQRDACENVLGNIFVEQGCKDEYGLVFAPFKKEDESCDYPLFLVYNEKGSGEMIGFGWLAPATDIKGSEALTEQEIKDLFPSNPECLIGKTAVNIWLAKDDSGKVSCQDVPAGQFVKERCQPKRRMGEDEDFD